MAEKGATCEEGSGRRGEGATVRRGETEGTVSAVEGRRAPSGGGRGAKRCFPGRGGECAYWKCVAGRQGVIGGAG
jgi:hypothetical protein